MLTSHDHPFISILAPIFTALIAEKRGAGNHYVKESRGYARFDQFCVDRDHHALALPRELVDAWTAKQPHKTERSRQRRLSLMRVLGQYMRKRRPPLLINQLFFEQTDSIQALSQQFPFRLMWAVICAAVRRSR